jgi:alpha-tubulin suppressor-like RCC1 family protein
MIIRFHHIGNAAQGQLGMINENITSINSTHSFNVTLPQGVAILVAGHDFYCALLLDRRTIYCWGQNSHGQLGFVNGTDTSDAYSFAGEMKPGPITDQGIKFVRDLSAGNSHVCAVVDIDDTQTGRVMCWGQNAAGQLGDVARPSTVRPIFLRVPCMNETRLAPMIPPTPVPGQPTPVPGQPTPVPAEPTLEPTPVPGAPTPLPTPYPTTVICAPIRLRWAFESKFPTFLLGPRGEQAARVFAGSSHTCALTVNGAVYCWGKNEAHQLGHAVLHQGTGRREIVGANETIAIALPDNMLSDVFDVSLAVQSTCVLSYNGFVKCFGSGTQGELGEDSNLVFSPTVVRDAQAGKEVVSRTSTDAFGKQISVDGSGYAHHLVGGASSHCFASKYKSVVCWGQSFISMFRGLVSVKPASSIGFVPGDSEPIVQLSRSHADYLFAAVTASGKLRVFGHRHYFDPKFEDSRTAVNNVTAEVELRRDVVLVTSDPACPNGRHGRDCSCTAPVPHFATCFKNLPTLRTPVERGETLRIERPLQLHHQQPIEGTVQFDLPKAFVQQAAELPVLTSNNGECKSVMEATFIVSMDVEDIKRLALVDIIRGCEPPGANSAVYRLDVRNFTASDECTNFTLERELVPNVKGVSVRVKRAPCMAATTASQTAAIVVVTLLIVAILLLAVGFFLRRYLRRARSSAGNDTVRPSASSSSPTDALSSGGRQSITSSADSGGLLAGHYARVSLGDDPTDVNVHAYDRVALGSQTSNEYARAPMANDYDKPTSRLAAKSDYDAATSPLEAGESEDTPSDPDAPQQYDKMPHAPRQRAETEL